MIELTSRLTGETIWVCWQGIDAVQADARGAVVWAGGAAFQVVESAEHIIAARLAERKKLAL